MQQDDPAADPAADLRPAAHAAPVLYLGGIQLDVVIETHIVTIALPDRAGSRARPVKLVRCLSSTESSAGPMTAPTTPPSSWPAGACSWADLRDAAAARIPDAGAVTVLAEANSVDFAVGFAAAVAGERHCAVLDPAWPAQLQG